MYILIIYIYIYRLQIHCIYVYTLALAAMPLVVEMVLQAPFEVACHHLEYVINTYDMLEGPVQATYRQQLF